MPSLPAPARAPGRTERTAQAPGAGHARLRWRLEERSRTKNPQLFAEESRIKAAEKTRDLTYKNRYPDFTLGVSPIQYQSAMKEWELMVELNIPLQQALAPCPGARVGIHVVGRPSPQAKPPPTRFWRNWPRTCPASRPPAAPKTLLPTSLLPQSELTFKAALAGV